MIRLKSATDAQVLGSPIDSSPVITLTGRSLSPGDLWRIAESAEDRSNGPKFFIGEEAREAIARSSRTVGLIAARSDAAYGINTGFGHLAERRIALPELGKLQHNLIRSHACAVGAELPRSIVLAMWVLRLHTICKGRSGIRPETVDLAVRLLNAGVLGCVPSRGSVGASGDLAAAAHAALPLLGEGRCTRPIHGAEGYQSVAAERVLSELRIAPHELGPKEGLALINGTQYTTALAIRAWSEGARLLRAANLAASMIMEAIGGSGSILEERVLRTHHPHTHRIGHEMAAWLRGSEAAHAARLAGRLLQAPYSVRCAPQVHGAVAYELDQAEAVLATEIDVISDNPLIFPETDDICSCGNFHAIFPARVSDKLASALTTLANISERRINLVMDERLSGLPTFLISDGGLNSGFMMAQVTAAALVSECKSLCMPASVDSIPTNCDREDHVSMGPAAGLKACQIVDHVRYVIAIELLVATQALDLRNGCVVPPEIRRVMEIVRSRVPFLAEDRVLAPDIEAVVELIRGGELEGAGRCER